MSEPHDAGARKTAVRTYDRNLVVLASAGTGKTSLLIERLLNQLIEQRLTLREIAAITFTEKAAAEMRGRLEAGLVALATPGGPERRNTEATRAWEYLRDRLGERETASRAEETLRELPFATISTIHGFCARILRRYGHALSIPLDFQVDEGIGYDDLKRRVWQSYVEGPDGPEGSRRDLWLAALQYLDLHEVQAIASHLANFTLRDLPVRAILPDARRVLSGWIETRVADIDQALHEGPSTEKGVGSYLGSAREALRAFLEGGPAELLDAGERLPYTATRGDRRSVVSDENPPTTKKFPAATQLAKELYRDLRELARLNDEALSQALAVALPFARAVRREAIQEGRLPFEALLTLTRDLLREFPEVRRQIGSRLRLMLVDEFQDTDPLQYEIVFLLAEQGDGPPAKDAFETRLAPGKLFIVGDPKQSIYGFRHADIAACHRAIDHVEGCGGLVLELTTTWRACDEIVRPLDGLFRRLFERDPHDESGLHPKYLEMQSGRGSGGEGVGIEVWTVDTEGNGSRRAEEARRDEAWAIARWIACDWMREGEKSNRRYAHVALLFRGLRNVHLYAHALRRCGIPFQLDRSRNLLEQPEIQQYWALLRAVSRPTDAPAVLGVLRSALGVAPDAELARYAAEGNKLWCYTEAEPDSSKFPNIARTFRWLRGWRSQAELVPTHRLITELLERSPLLALQATVREGRGRVTSLRSVATRLAGIARGEPGWPLGRVLEAFEGLVREGSTGGGEAVAGEESDAVQLLSFHAAKGLEFPVVFVVDLSSSPEGHSPAGGEAAEVGMDGAPPALWIRTPRLRSALSLLAAENKEQRERAETRRLLYVACTRAKERLILVNSPRGKSGPDAWAAFLEPWGYPPEGLTEEGTLPREARVRHRLESPSPTTLAAGPPRERSNWSDEIRRAEQAAERAQAAVRPTFHRPSGLREDEEAREEMTGDEETAVRYVATGDGLARAVGIAVHDALERWDFREPDRARALTAGAAQRASRTTGLDAASVVAATREVLEAFLRSELPSYLASVEVLGREVPFLLDERGLRWSGTIDLIYRQPDGTLVVADYKTDREVPDPVPENYREQLSVYARALRRAFPGEAEPGCELLYVRGGKRIRLLE